MPIIEIDQDLYDYLLRNANRIGEDASSILRRLLGLPDPGRYEPPRSDEEASELVRFLRSRAMLPRRSVTDRYLALLGWLGKHHEDETFEEKLLSIRGRKRVYFARTEQEIADSGKSTHPQEIPGLGLWAMTNADSSQKADIARRLMESLGYNAHEVRLALQSLTE